jgi:hypothetical protein
MCTSGRAEGASQTTRCLSRLRVLRGARALSATVFAVSCLGAVGCADSDGGRPAPAGPCKVEYDIGALCEAYPYCLRDGVPTPPCDDAETVSDANHRRCGWRLSAGVAEMRFSAPLAIAQGTIHALDVIVSEPASVEVLWDSVATECVSVPDHSPLWVTCRVPLPNPHMMEVVVRPAVPGRSLTTALALLRGSCATVDESPAAVPP